MLTDIFAHQQHCAAHDLLIIAQVNSPNGYYYSIHLSFWLSKRKTPQIELKILSVVGRCCEFNW